MSTFARFSEQAEPARLLEAAVREGPAHAYLFHGPPGIGKRETALVFARALLGTQRDFHPDLYQLDALGEMIRIDAIRELRRDLHMRPFEADRRVYLIFSADLMNEDAADALLKDLEEPPPYAVIVLVADDIGPISETIRSRCQLVPFRRLGEKSVRELVDARAPHLSEDEKTSLARVAGGRLDRLERLLDPAAVARRDALIDCARGAYTEDGFDPAEAAATLLRNAAERGAEARELEEAQMAGLDLPAREAEQRAKRAERGAEREELLAELEELAAWYRDLVAVAVGAEAAAIHLDKLDLLRRDATRDRIAGAEAAAEAVRQLWRELEEFNLAPQLAVEALFVRVVRELST